MLSLKSSKHGLAKIKQARVKKGWPIDDANWLETAREFLPPVKVGQSKVKGTVSLGTWKRFLKGTAVKTQNYKAFCAVLGLDWEEVVDLPQPSEKKSKKKSPQLEIAQTKQDWGNAPNLNNFYGRIDELSTLKKWILEDSCNLVAIVGIGGVGKTDLSVSFGKGGIGKSELSLQFARGIESEFDYIIWRSLLNAPLLQNLLLDLISFLSNQQETELPQGLEQQLSLFIHFLEKNRSLLILDNYESILTSGNDNLQYREGYEGYGELLRKLGNSSHQSCIVLTSREVPPDFSPELDANGQNRLLKLCGLSSTLSTKRHSKVSQTKC